METDFNKNSELDKSFCKDSSTSSLNLSDKKCQNLIREVNSISDHDFSEELLSSFFINSKPILLNLSNPSSKELNLLDNSDPKFKTQLSFFRRLTKSEKEIHNEEEKYITEKILKFNKKHNLIHENEINLLLDIYDGEQASVSRLLTQQNIGNTNDDILVENINMFPYENGAEIKLYEKNKKIYLNLHKKNFNILIVGEGGSGKTKFINYFMKCLNHSLSVNNKNSRNDDNYTFNFTSDSIRLLNKTNSNKIRCVKSTIEVTSSKEIGDKLYDLIMYDYPGFPREEKNNLNWQNDMLKFIKRKYKKYFEKKEAANDQQTVHDGRIHLCLYFTNSATQFDFETMKEISKSANLIPIIGNGKNFTRQEVTDLKSKIRNEGIQKYNIKFLEIEEYLHKLNIDAREINSLLGGNYSFCPPYYIFSSSSNSVYHDDSCSYLSDEYWESDFSRLYNIIISFLSFECINNTKIIYKKLKKKWNNLKMQKEINHNKEKCNSISYMPYIFPFVALVYFFNLNQKKIV